MKLLEERNKTHGDFDSGAVLTYTIKALLGNHTENLSEPQKEALDMIPENQDYSLDDLFPRLLEMDELLAFEVKERFYEIGSPQGLNEFKEFVRMSYVRSPTSRITKTNI